MLVFSISAESSKDQWGGIGRAIWLMRGDEESPLRFVEIVPGRSDLVDGNGFATIASSGLGTGANPVYSAPDRASLRLTQAGRSADLLKSTFGQPDLIIVHNEELVGIGRSIGDELDVPITYASHSDLSVEHPTRPDARDAQVYAISQSDAVIAFSPGHVAHLKKKWDIEASLVLLPLACLFPSRRPRPQRAHKNLVVSAGRAVFHKGFDVALEALGSLRNCEAEIAVGKGDRRVQKNLQDHASLLPHVRLSGWRRGPELERFLQRSALVVIPSRFEPLGLFAAEAILLRRPVVVTDAVGLSGLLEDSAHVVPAEDPAALAKSIEIGIAGALDVDSAEDQISTYSYHRFIESLWRTT